MAQLLEAIFVGELAALLLKYQARVQLVMSRHRMQGETTEYERYDFHVVGPGLDVNLQDVLTLWLEDVRDERG